MLVMYKSSQAAHDLPARLRNGSNPLGRLAVQGGIQPNQGSTVSTNVVLIGAELSPLSGDSLELLLRRSISIANVHEKSFFTNPNAVKLSNDFVAHVTGLKAVAHVRRWHIQATGRLTEQNRLRGCFPCYHEESCWKGWCIPERLFRVPVQR